MIGLLDLVTASSFLAALIGLARVPDELLSRDCRVLLGVCLGTYTLVGLSNTLESTGITSRLDFYEDYLELLFIPFFAYFVYAAGTSRELRARQAAEDSLRRSEQLYRTLVENVDLGISLVDAQYRVVMANAAQGRLFEKLPQEFVGRECFREFEKRATPCEHCPGARAMATGAPQEHEASGVRDDGSRFAARVRAFPIREADGSAAGFIEVVEDITQQKTAAEERRRLEIQMQQAQKLESLGVLAGGIAHDFNNLLMGILGNADLARMKMAPESPALPFVRKIVTASERAADLTNQMLAYSGKGRFAVESVNLSQLVEEMAHLLETVISKKTTLQLDLCDPLPAVEADATQLRQVVLNLITNASEALGDRGGVVTLTTGVSMVDAQDLEDAVLDDPLPTGACVYLEVADTGCGMDADTRARIFDPFFTTKFAGRGLGLAALLGIVRSHHGAIKVTSRPGAGSTFTVLLPCAAGFGEPADRNAVDHQR